MRKIFFTFLCMLSALTTFGQGSAKVNSLALPKYPVVGTGIQIKGQVQNVGATNITSFKFNYAINGGQTVSATVSQSIGTGAIVTVTHSTNWVPATAIKNTIKVWITDINTTGGANSASNNGEITSTVTTATQLVDKHVLMEYYSGEWCGWCPDGALTIQNIKNEFGNKIIASTIHQGDFMQNNSGVSMINAFAISGYPSGTVDRKSPSGGGAEVMNRGSFRDAVAAQLTANPQVPIGIDIEQTYNCNTRQITLKANTNFYAPMDERMRISFFVQEDGVIGQGQRNFLNTTAGHPYQGLGDPIPNYSHKDVYRGTTGSIYGQPITSTIAAGTKANQTFNFTVPAGWDLNKIYLVVAIVNDGTAQGQREVYNVRRVKLETTLPMLSFFSSGDSYVNKTVAIPFTTAGCPADPTVTVTSSNQAVLPNANLSLSGTGLNRTLTINTGTVTGFTDITISATADGKTINRTFQYIVQDQTTSLEASDIFSSVQIYPNPSSRFVEVETGNLGVQNLQFNMYDLSGKVQKMSKPIIGENKATIDLKDLKEGTYLLEISNEKGKAIRKIVKQ